MHFLEIQYQIVKNFTPAQLVNPKTAEDNAVADMHSKEKARKRSSAFIRSMRHGKFGM